MSVSSLRILEGLLIKFFLSIRQRLKVGEYFEELLIYSLQIKNTHFLKSIVITQDKFTFPRRRSQNRLDMGKSISLSSAMLLAISIPARLKSS